VIYPQIIAEIGLVIKTAPTEALTVDDKFEPKNFEKTGFINSPKVKIPNKARYERINDIAEES
jgi:hypothetical protein